MSEQRDYAEEQWQRTEAEREGVEELAEAVIEGWVHSGPCINCAHGPACVTCDPHESPYFGQGEYPGPVCRNCAEECQRGEIAADPYYSGDYVTMFGDDE